MTSGSTGNKIVFLSEGNRNQASAAHRVYPLAQYLESHGWTVEIFHGIRRTIGLSRIWIVGLLKAIAVYRALNSGDVLVIHRTSNIFVLSLVRTLKWFKKVRVVFDFDDAIQLKKRFGLKNPLFSSIAPIIRLSDVTWCGSHYLLDFANRHGSGIFLPTPVGREFLTSKGEGTTPPTILWVGNGPGQIENLSLLVPPLLELAETTEFRLFIASSMGSQQIRELFRPLEGRIRIDFGWEEWLSLEEVVSRVKDADIGVMPLVDSEWNRGKCAMKALECMALGLPTVISPVGENLFVADDGQYSLLASDPQQWCDQLHRLIADEHLRSNLGRKGRALIETDYTPDVVFAKALASLAALFRN